MKKIISLILVAVLLLSFSACNDTNKNSEENSNKYEPSTLPLDIEQLKYNWTDGIITFANGNQITVPCTVSQFVEASGLEIQNADIISNKVLEPDDSKDIYLVNDKTYISIECENTTAENLTVLEATVVEYNFTNVKEGNREIKFANTLTAGAGKADVEEALGTPKDTAAENSLYYYKGKNSKGEKVELRIGFNSDDVVNSVAFEIDD